MKKLKQFHVGNFEMLSQQEMMNLSDGETTFTCKTNDNCKLYIPALQITVDGKCEYYVMGTSVSCYCKNGSYYTSPSSQSYCWK